MRKANRPAFPTYGFYEDGRSIITGGLTKREYAAILIRAGMEGGNFSTTPYHRDTGKGPIAPCAYAVREADRLLAELEKTDG